MVQLGPPPTLPPLCERAPAARWLVTSRVRTEIEGESLVELRPLTLPRREDDVRASEAVQLFVDRAQQVVPD